MITSHLIKMANMLDAVGTPEAAQAAEGIDAVLYSAASADPLMDIYQALDSAVLRQALSDAQEMGMAGPESKLQEYVTRVADAMEALRGGVSKLPGFKEGLDKKFPPIAEDNTGDTGDTASSTPPMTFPGQDVGSDTASMKAPKISSLLANLIKVTDFLDSQGHSSAANILDTIIKDAIELPTYPSRMDVREEAYDAPKHNTETMWEVTKDEVAKNRQEHHLETHRPTADALSTRYSPELPGVQALRVSDGVYQDILTKEIYDFNTGWTGRDGRKYPGGSIKNQTPNYTQYANPSRMFDMDVPLSKSRD
jgi:hypothetical protein